MRMTRNISWDDIASSQNRHLADTAERPDTALENAERKRLIVILRGLRCALDPMREE